MWEKELVEKFRKPYVIGQATQYGTKLVQQKVDPRYDDENVTPKADEKVTPKGVKMGNFFPNQIVNITSNYPQPDSEENEAPPAQLDSMAI